MTPETVAASPDPQPSSHPPTAEQSPAIPWHRAPELLKGQMERSTFNSLLGPSEPVEICDDVWTVAVRRCADTGRAQGHADTGRAHGLAPTGWAQGHDVRDQDKEIRD
jgi:hypothetical protein